MPSARRVTADSTAHRQTADSIASRLPATVFSTCSPLAAPCHNPLSPRRISFARCTKIVWSREDLCRLALLSPRSARRQPASSLPYPGPVRFCPSPPLARHSSSCRCSAGIASRIAATLAAGAAAFTPACPPSLYPRGVDHLLTAVL